MVGVWMAGWLDEIGTYRMNWLVLCEIAGGEMTVGKMLNRAEQREMMEG